MDKDLAVAKADFATIKEVKKKAIKEKDGLNNLLIKKTKYLEIFRDQAREARILRDKVANAELENVNSLLSSQLLKVHK